MDAMAENEDTDTVGAIIEDLDIYGRDVRVVIENPDSDERFYVGPIGTRNLAGEPVVTIEMGDLIR